MYQMINTSIIIVNWNGRPHLEVCLKSVFDQTYRNFEVIFVDNGSADDSVEYVKKNYPQVSVIECKKNYGFAEGNNIGIHHALKNREIKYIVTLNNDTEVDKDWLRQLIEVAERDEKIGAVSSKMLFFDRRNIIDSAGDFLLPGSLKTVTRGYKQEDKGQFERIEECFSARAGAALYRRAMLEEVCLKGDYFDSNFFAYIEDTDLSVRARLKGWKIVFAPQAVVYHKVASTTKKMSYIFRRYYSGRNRLFTAIKNYQVKLWPLVLRGTSSVDTDYILSFGDKLKVYIKIIGSLFIFWPRLLRQRRHIRKTKKISNEEICSWINKYSLSPDPSPPRERGTVN
jgi:GT2 family glycosyltransferase